MSTVFILHFAPSLHFTLSLQSAFYTRPAFYPCSAVCSPQSSFYTDRMYNSIYETYFCKLLSANFQHSTFGFAILCLKISVLIPYITPYILPHFMTETIFIIFQQVFERLYMRFFKVK